MLLRNRKAINMVNTGDTGSSTTDSSDNILSGSQEQDSVPTTGSTGYGEAHQEVTHTSSSVITQQCHYNRIKPKFSGNNNDFLPWEELFEAHTMDMGMDDIFTQDSPDPTRNKQLYYELIKCLDYNSIKIVSSNAKYDGKLAFKILKDHYLGDTAARRRVALHEIVSIKWRDNDTSQTYLTRTDILKSKLMSLNLLADEEQLIISTIKGLPDKYDSIRIHLTGDDSIKTYSVLKQKIISQLARHENSTSTTTSTSLPKVMSITDNVSYRPFIRRPYSRGRYFRGYNFRGGRPTTFHNSHDRSQVQCSYCGMTNHTYENCYKRMQSESTAGATPGRNQRGGGARGSRLHRGANHLARGARGGRPQQQQQQYYGRPNVSHHRGNFYNNNGSTGNTNFYKDTNVSKQCA